MMEFHDAGSGTKELQGTNCLGRDTSSTEPSLAEQRITLHEFMNVPG